MLRSTRAAVPLFAALLFAGCATPENPPAGSGGWSRTVEHAAGTTELTSKPTRIVSTSPSLTGALLAIGAPVVGSAATTPSGLSDDKGFFTQWASEADARGVEVAYDGLALNLEAVQLLEPDLIIGSSNGGDSTLDAYDQLSAIAPTVLIDYGTPSWEDVTRELGTATGLDDEAERVVDDYDAWVAEQAAKIALPEQPVTALVYLQADGVWAFTSDSPQGKLLTSLGFTYNDPPADLQTPRQGASGVAVVSPENLSAAFADSRTLFAVSMGPADQDRALTAEPLLANQVAVSQNRVFSLGTAAFRLDYYSAMQTVDLLVSLFQKGR
ncbi:MULTISPECIES: Fe2+-enterobactin ABC transporter substrate-binding protein [Rhodococcus]|uniref:Fe2+-enterobactin ABC transporter substrate-binding protein n=1 Tax=Rhodococcoides kyotonense TaxID=398843 RepID=A0A177Y7I1_9NOCA|nr:MULTISPECIES: Fe2+-enterobactin ABC transporter substrate-binding protein [Rhodococcus]NIL77702.1 Ferrienterobactin-binding periplasmic protein [Rhodococcus sp. B10]OAK51476.1 Fe2+-enterobactin ABC transporter substrate-binding protein [Rhodococcus kyotonensis]